MQIVNVVIKKKGKRTLKHDILVTPNNHVSVSHVAPRPTFKLNKR